MNTSCQLAIPFPVVLMRALICAREYGSSEWPNTWTPSMWEDNAVQNLSRQTMTTTIWYCMNLYIYIYYMPCSQALVLAVPTAGINWQIGPCDRRNEWVGGTSALSNIKLMGRTIGASTALCMTAAKHSQVSLPSSWNSNFQTEQAQIPNNLVPSGLRRWLRYRRKRAWRSQLAWFTCGKLFPPLEEIKYAKVRKDIISWCCNNWVEFGNKHVQLHISKYKSIVY